MCGGGGRHSHVTDQGRAVQALVGHLVTAGAGVDGVVGGSTAARAPYRTEPFRSHPGEDVADVRDAGVGREHVGRHLGSEVVAGGRDKLRLDPLQCGRSRLVHLSDALQVFTLIRVF